MGVEGQRESVTIEEQKIKPVSSTVIPSGQVVILRENELDCELSTAIQRIRSNEQTSHSRILIVGPETPESEQEELSRARGVPSMPTSVGQVARSGGVRALETLGEELQVVVESQERFIEEAQMAVREVDDAVQEGTRAQLKNRLCNVTEILDWSRAVHEDIQQRVQAAVGGFQSVDAYDLLRDLQGQVETFFPELRISIPACTGASHCHGRATDLAEGLFLALSLTAQRIGGQGALRVEINQVKDHLQIRLQGVGDPQHLQAAKEMARCREILVQQHGGRILPDNLGKHAAGMLIQLPLGP